MQEFLETGVYVNRLDLLGGALRTSLRAEAAPSRADRLDLVFGDVHFQLGPLKFTQASLSTGGFVALCRSEHAHLCAAASAGNAQKCQQSAVSSEHAEYECRAGVS